jgi:hypothetical protein
LRLLLLLVVACPVAACGSAFEEGGGHDGGSDGAPSTDASTGPDAVSPDGPSLDASDARPPIESGPRESGAKDGTSGADGSAMTFPCGSAECDVDTQYCLAETNSMGAAATITYSCPPFDVMTCDCSCEAKKSGTATLDCVVDSKNPINRCRVDCGPPMFVEAGLPDVVKLPP